MISDFSFESPFASVSDSTKVRPPHEGGVALQLPFTIPERLFDLDGLDASVNAAVEHFAPLELLWVIEAVRGGGARATASLKTKSGSERGIWSLVVLEAASTGRHQHKSGGAYGECLITLVGGLDDVFDDGTAVRLGPGDVMFHAPDTIHEAVAEQFWLGIIHQPRGCVWLT